MNTTGWVDPLGLKGGPYDIAPHYKQPSGRPTGLESHHIVQSAWASQNIPGYSHSKAPTMLLPRHEHNAITTAQYARRCARMRAGNGPFSSTPRDELNHVASDYDRAGISEKHKRRAIKSAYRTMFA